MQTVTVEILNAKAYRLLEDLEDLEVIKLHNKTNGVQQSRKIDLSTLRGSIQTGLTVDEIDAQFRSIRDEWDRDIS